MKYVLLTVAAILAACTYHNIERSQPSLTKPVIDTSWVSVFDPRTLKVSAAFDSGSVIGEVDNPDLDEISGIAASYNSVNSLWVEEDSGNPNKISLLARNGKFLGDVSIEYVANRDWEDMSISTGPMGGAHYIYLADIGDNNQTYKVKFVYRFEEPSFTLGSSPFHSSLGVFDIISFSLPDEIKNSEAIMIDPLTKDFYIISKESDKAVVYLAQYPQPINSDFTLMKIGTLPISKVTAADISPDGSEILIKNYVQVFYWKRSTNQSISSTLKSVPVQLTYQIEPQGEAICFAMDGSGLYTTSESVDASVPSIYFYKRK